MPAQQTQLCSTYSQTILHTSRVPRQKREQQPGWPPAVVITAARSCGAKTCMTTRYSNLDFDIQ